MDFICLQVYIIFWVYKRFSIYIYIYINVIYNIDTSLVLNDNPNLRPTLQTRSPTNPNSDHLIYTSSLDFGGWTVKECLIILHHSSMGNEIKIQIWFPLVNILFPMNTYTGIKLTQILALSNNGSKLLRALTIRW